MPSVPNLSQELINTIGEYGMARTDGVSEAEVLHRWQLVLSSIKRYAHAYGDARAEHARRSALDVGVRTGHPPGLLQDDDKKLSKWLASRPDSMRRAREAVEAIEKETKP